MPLMQYWCFRRYSCVLVKETSTNSKTLWINELWVSFESDSSLVDHQNFTFFNWFQTKINKFLSTLYSIYLCECITYMLILSLEQCKFVWNIHCMFQAISHCSNDRISKQSIYICISAHLKNQSSLGNDWKYLDDTYMAHPHGPTLIKLNG